jgi:CheY-like chemotaxis protein
MRANGHRVLLVEDEPDTREALRLLLEDKGYAVDTAENGWRALQICSRGQPPCVVVLDLMMPFMSGWEFSVELHKQERLSRVPIVVLSGLADTQLTEVPQAVARIQKPVDVDTLYRLLEKHC